MPTNDFLTFALDTGANVLAQADYSALTARSTGFTAGTARSAELNKVWRQAAFAVSSIAQFMADYTGSDVLDNGDSASFKALFTKAVALLSMGTDYAVDTGSANTYIAAFTPAVTALVDGMVLRFKAKTANTGGSTFNPNGLGALPIVLPSGSALGAGVIAAGSEVWLQYNSTLNSWVSVLSASFAAASTTQAGISRFATSAEVSTGTATNIAVDPAGIASAYAKKATTLGGYGITDAYTSAQTDTLLTAKAPLASPALTGTPTAPTAAAGNMTTQLATTAFAMGNRGMVNGGRGGLGLSVDTTLTASGAVGSWFELQAPGVAITLPALSSCILGDTVTFRAVYDATLKGAGTDNIASYAVKANTLSVAAGQVVTLASNGSAWYVISDGMSPAAMTAFWKDSNGLSRLAALSAVGAVGTYALLTNRTGAIVTPGGTAAGASLTYSNTEDNVPNGGAVSGTWMCMGYAKASVSDAGTTLWLRIA